MKPFNELTLEEIADITTFTSVSGHKLLLSKVRWFSDTSIYYEGAGELSFDSPSTAEAFKTSMITYEYYKTSLAANDLASNIEGIKKSITEAITNDFFQNMKNHVETHYNRIDTAIQSLGQQIEQKQDNINELLSSTYNAAEQAKAHLTDSAKILKAKLSEIPQVTTAIEALKDKATTLSTITNKVEALLKEASWSPEDEPKH